MGFLDNLENNLDALEKSGAERDEDGRERERRKSEAAAQGAVAPWAEKLKKSAFTEELLRAAMREGHRVRTKVYTTWLGDVLRLQARERRLEFRPAPNGVQAVTLIDGEETRRELLDLTGDPAALVREWMPGELRVDPAAFDDL